jgi:hypothetical protein
VSHLEVQCKASAGKVRSYFMHVPAELAERRASQLGAGDFVPAIGALVQAGMDTRGGLGLSHRFPGPSKWKDLLS